jgi:hypothetical protein
VNPWGDLPIKPPFVLPADRREVEGYQARVRDPKQRLAVDRLPEPWVGDPSTATVLMLQLNPGYKPAEDDALHARDDYRDVVRRSLLHRQQDTQFHYLDPRFAESGGARWCRKKNRWALESVGDAVVAARYAHLEWFPYRSTRAGRLPQVPSQAYSIHLLRQALDRNAVIITARKLVAWEQAVPELISYPYRLGTSSVQAVFLSPNNLTLRGHKTPEAFELFIEALNGMLPTR